ncbi:MAG: HhH-GPD-type base excision DNA repair protein [Acidimicrobiales bacterium]
MATLRLSGDPEADTLLSEDPLALLIGMVLDQQVPLEWAFAAPAELRRRLGRDLDAGAIAAMTPEALGAAFTAKPALHRYPGSMAARVYDLCRLLVDDYGGTADAVWAGAASGSELLGRVRALPGFGEQKAKIFVALLGKQLGVTAPGWREVSVPFGEPGSFRSVADIVDQASLDRVRAFKQDMKAKAKAAAAATGTPAKKTAAKRAPAKKAPAKRAPAKRAPARKAAATKAAGTKAAGTKVAATRAPAAKTTVRARVR